MSCGTLFKKISLLYGVGVLLISPVAADTSELSYHFPTPFQVQYKIHEKSAQGKPQSAGKCAGKAPSVEYSVFGDGYAYQVQGVGLNQSIVSSQTQHPKALQLGGANHVRLQLEQTKCYKFSTKSSMRVTFSQPMQKLYRSLNYGLGKKDACMENASNCLWRRHENSFQTDSCEQIEGYLKSPVVCSQTRRAHLRSLPVKIKLTNATARDALVVYDARLLRYCSSRSDGCTEFPVFISSDSVTRNALGGTQILKSSQTAAFFEEVDKLIIYDLGVVQLLNEMEKEIGENGTFFVPQGLALLSVKQEQRQFVYDMAKAQTIFWAKGQQPLLFNMTGEGESFQTSFVGGGDDISVKEIPLPTFELLKSISGQVSNKNGFFFSRIDESQADERLLVKLSEAEFDVAILQNRVTENDRGETYRRLEAVKGQRQVHAASTKVYVPTEAKVLTTTPVLAAASGGNAVCQNIKVHSKLGYQPSHPTVYSFEGMGRDIEWVATKYSGAGKSKSRYLMSREISIKDWLEFMRGGAESCEAHRKAFPGFLVCKNKQIVLSTEDSKQEQVEQFKKVWRDIALDNQNAENLEDCFTDLCLYRRYLAAYVTKKSPVYHSVYANKYQKEFLKIKDIYGDSWVDAPFAFATDGLITEFVKHINSKNTCKNIFSVAPARKQDYLHLLSERFGNNGLQTYGLEITQRLKGGLIPKRKQRYEVNIKSSKTNGVDQFTLRPNRYGSNSIVRGLLAGVYEHVEGKGTDKGCFGFEAYQLARSFDPASLLKRPIKDCEQELGGAAGFRLVLEKKQ